MSSHVQRYSVPSVGREVTVNVVFWHSASLPRSSIVVAVSGVAMTTRLSTTGSWSATREVTSRLSMPQVAPPSTAARNLTFMSVAA